MSLKFVYREGSPPELTLTGSIDESADFTQLHLPKTKILAINLDGITHVNSLGIRSWIQWVATLTNIETYIFKKCPMVIINQVNILQGLLPAGSSIESFYIPFFCASCGHDGKVLAERGKDFYESSENKDAQIEIRLERICPKCNQLYCADVAPARYFRFLRYDYLKRSK